MNEISVFDDAIYGLFKNMAKENQANWMRRILELVIKEESIPFSRVKQELKEVPEILAFECLRKMVRIQILEELKQEGKMVQYKLVEEGSYIREILKAL